MCGEKSTIFVSIRLAVGSPPRVRGKGKGSLYHRPVRGITPACAGKSSRFCHCIPIPRDHPRVCGEKGGTQVIGESDKGSPPRVRGKVFSKIMAFHASRITPACAGKSKKPRSKIHRKGDHPRVCGEKRGGGSHLQAPGGSPPRVRGKVGDTYEEIRHDRITPACAGKSFSKIFSGLPPQDHPRVCGEKRSRSR